LRIATIRRGGEEVAAVVVPGGAVPVRGISDPDGDGWPAALLSLLESGRLDELKSHVSRLETSAEELSARAIPHGGSSTVPSTGGRARSGA
jgi:hypothetical protein